MSSFVDKLIFDCNENDCCIGSRTSLAHASTSGITDPSYVGKVTIPEFHERKPIRYIGYCAFFDCSKITEVKIDARVFSIYKYAFGYMPSLTSINIPQTCTYIGTASIYPLNSSNVANPNATGSLTVYFEPNSKIENISRCAFGRKEKIILIMCEKIKTLENSNIQLYQYVDCFEILSPYAFSIGGINTIATKYIVCKHATHIRTCVRLFISEVFFMKLLLLP